MNLLLDTHVLLWAMVEPRRLSARAADAITDPDNDVFASAVSGYEIAFKQSLAKLDMLNAGDLALRMRSARMIELPLSIDDTVAAGLLPGPHRDPWDRMLIAQAMRRQLTVATVDAVFARYGVPVLW